MKFAFLGERNCDILYGNSIAHYFFKNIYVYVYFFALIIIHIVLRGFNAKRDFSHVRFCGECNIFGVADGVFSHIVVFSLSLFVFRFQFKRLGGENVQTELQN